MKQKPVSKLSSCALILALSCTFVLAGCNQDSSLSKSNSTSVDSGSGGTGTGGTGTGGTGGTGSGGTGSGGTGSGGTGSGGTGSGGTGSGGTGSGGTGSGGTGSGGTGSGGTGSGGTGSGGTGGGTVTGSATLHWQPPTTNVDGSALTDLAGYDIYYGTDANNLSQTIRISNSGTTSYKIDNLTTGTYYFGVASYTSAGIEGILSALVSKTI